MPARAAAPVAETVFVVGGTVTYTLFAEEGPVTIRLLSATITVLPEPVLYFAYFMPGFLQGDNPFTPNVEEPSVPTPLCAQVHNGGSGAAHGLTLSTGSPQIVSNDKNILVSFSIVGTILNGDETSAPQASITTTFGTLHSGATATLC